MVANAEIEARAKEIYLTKYGEMGGRWELVDTKDVWRERARMALNRSIPTQCPCCGATEDFIQINPPKKMTLPKGQIVTTYWCKKCTACLCEDVTYED